MVSLKHKFQSQLPDGVNPSLIRPSNWNDEHDLILSQTGVVVGRRSADSGPAEELTAVDLAAILDGKFLTALVDDTSPQLGGDLDLNGHHITGLQIGIDVQAYDADLTTWAGLAPSTNFQTMVPHTFAQMRTDLGLVIGADVQAWDADLDTWATKTAPSGTVLGSDSLDTDGTLSANSDSKIATQKAIKTYADQLIAAADVMVFKGVVDCSANPNYPAADAGYTYRVSVAGKIGGSSGISVEVGDLLLCLVDGAASGNQATVGTNWSVAQTNIDGAVVGPSSATSGNIATFSGTTGRLIQDGGIASSSLLKTSDIGTSVQGYDADLDTWATKTSPSGAVVGTTDTQTLTNKTLSLASNTVNYIPSGTGAVARSVAGKLQSRIDPLDFGCAGDGTTDDTANMQKAIDYLYSIGGGVLDLSFRRWLIDSADLEVKDGVFLVGPWRNFGFRADEDYTAIKSAIIVNPSYTVRTSGSGHGVKGLVILKKGLTKPTTLRQCYDLAATFAGVGITLGTGVVGAVTDSYLGYLFIAGFAQGIECDGPSRPHIEYIQGDCTAGIHIANCFDMEHVSHCHFWPFLTAAYTPAAYAVSGTANNGSGLIRLTLATNVLQTGDIITVKSVTGTTEANGRWTVTVVDSTHVDLQGSTFTHAYVFGGTAYFSAWRRTGTGILFDDTVDWGQMSDCFTFGYDNGITIDDSNHTTLVNCGSDNYATAADPTTVGIWITGTSEMCSLDSCKTSAQGVNLKIDASATNSDTVSVTNHRSWGPVTYLAQLKDGTAKFVNCQWQTGGIIRIEAASGQPAFFGGDLTGVTFSYAASAPIASSYDVDGTPTKLVLVENTNSTSNRIAYFAGNNSTPAANDTIYASYVLNNSAGIQKEAFRQSVRFSTHTDGAESSQIFWGAYTAGTFADKLLLAGNANTLCPAANDSLALGVGSLGWSDLFLATGGVINWGNGNATITHSSGLLASNVPFKLPSYTVATLPSASTMGAGAQAYVTDSNATTFNSTVAGGGSNKIRVTSDGTNWKIG